MEEQQQEEQSQPKTNRALQIKTFFGGLCVTEGIDLIAHGGWQGAAFAAGLAAILAVKSPELAAPFRDMLPPLPTWGGRSLVDRALGRYPDEPHEGDVDSARLAELATMPYTDYLQTPEWHECRQRIRERDNNRCQDCGSTMRLDVHHLTYERRGNELDADLVTLCHACHGERHGIVEDAPMETLQLRAQQPQLTLPKQGTLRAPSTSAYFTFSDVLAKGFTPSLQRIYLATLEDGTDVCVPASKLCHVALAGLTRGGKGHIKRSLMAQLCAAGAEVYLLDPKYTRWDRESEDPTGKPCPEDWTPYTPYLQNDPSEQVPVKQKYQVIGGYLLAAKQELDRRLERYGNSQPVGVPMFLFIDELPDIVDNIPEAPGYLKSILRMGAGLGMYVVALSQDFLVKTLFPNEGGAVRDCFRTVLYVGGDATTARILLDMPAKDVPENRIGKGRVMLRCDVVRPASEARVPYVDNQALYQILGPSTYVETEYEEERNAGAQLKPAPRYESQALPDTEKLPTATHRVAKTSYEAYQARKTTHRVAGSAPRVQGTPMRTQDDPISELTQDERQVLDAYRSGLKTGNAIASETPFSSTRANQILNRLARLKLIDWQPRKV